MSALRQFSPEEIAALHRAFTSYANADERWRSLSASGATDARLREFIERELGIGGSSGPNRVSVSCHNSPPRIWLYEFNGYAGRKKPTLAGQDLLNAARAMFGVGDPAPPGQQSLFE